MSVQILFHIEVFIAGYFLWQGLYVLTRAVQGDNRSWYERVDYHTAVASLLVALFLFGVNMEFVSRAPAKYIAWLKATWWALPPALGLWLRAIILLPHPTKPEMKIALWKHVLSITLILWGLSFGPINLLSDFFFAYDQIAVNAVSPFGVLFLPRNFPAYYLHAAHFLGTIYVTVFLTGVLWVQVPTNAPQRKTINRVFLGSLLILVGGSIAAFNYLFWDYRLPQPFGDAISALGLAILGRHLINYNASLNERVLASDYRRSAVYAIINVSSMLIFFHGMHWLTEDRLSFLSSPLLVIIGVFISTMMPVFQRVLNRITLSHWEAALFQEIDLVEERVLTASNQHVALQAMQGELNTISQAAQNEQMQSLIQKEISHIFRHNAYYRDDLLADSGLFSLGVIRDQLASFAHQYSLPLDQVPAQEKANLLRQILSEHVDALCPAEIDSSNAQTTQQQIEYLMLRRRYIDRQTRDEIIDEIIDTVGLRLTNNGRSYTLHLTRARQSLANQIWLAEYAYLPVLHCESA